MTEKKFYYIKKNIFYKLLDNRINNIDEYIEDFVEESKEITTVDGKNILPSNAIESLEIHFVEIKGNAVKVIINFNDEVSEDSRKCILDALNNYLYDRIKNFFKMSVDKEEIRSKVEEKIQNQEEIDINIIIDILSTVQADNMSVDEEEIKEMTSKVKEKIQNQEEIDINIIIDILSTVQADNNMSVDEEEIKEMASKVKEKIQNEEEIKEMASKVKEKIQNQEEIDINIIIDILSTVQADNIKEDKKFLEPELVDAHEINRHVSKRGVKKSKKRSGVKKSKKRGGVKKSKKRGGVKKSKKRSGVKKSKKRSGVKKSKKRSGVKKSKKRSGVN